MKEYPVGDGTWCEELVEHGHECEDGEMIMWDQICGKDLPCPIHSVPAGNTEGGETGE